MRIHTGQKPFICGVCSKAFRTSSYLNAHKRTHRNKDNLPLVGDECGHQVNALSSPVITDIGDGDNTLSSAVTTDIGDGDNTLSSAVITDTGDGDNTDNILPIRLPDEMHGAALTISSAAETVRLQRTDDDAKTVNVEGETFHLFNMATQPRLCEKMCKDNFLCNPLSSHSYGAFGETFDTAGETVGVQRTDDDTKTLNTMEQMFGKSQLTHTGTKVYNCPFCNKEFDRPSKFKIHQLIHIKVKPHKCDICHKGFSEAGNLKVHMRTHSGQKPFVCNVCLKAFSTSSILNKHRRMHKTTEDVVPSVSGECGQMNAVSSAVTCDVHDGENTHNMTDTSLILSQLYNAGRW